MKSTQSDSYKTVPISPIRKAWITTPFYRCFRSLVFPQTIHGFLDEAPPAYLSVWYRGRKIAGGPVLSIEHAVGEIGRVCRKLGIE